MTTSPRRLTTLLLLGSLASCVDAPTDESELGSEISGGTVDSDHLYPWVVTVQSQVGCHGTLIDARWVLTAAHCVRYSGATIRYSRMAPGATTPSVGEAKVSPSGVFIHPDYSSYRNHDIALLRLDTELPYNAFVRPAALPNAFGTPGYTGTVASRNAANLGAGQVGIYRAPIILPRTGVFSTKSATASLCPGDSGSGFVIPYGGKHIVFGVASQGSGGDTCAPGNEVDFASVYDHAAWITEVSGVIAPTYDGHADLLWRKADGTPSIWFMEDRRQLGQNEPTWYGQPGVSNDWKIAGVGELSNDGRPDILWRHTNGALSAWFLVDGMLTGSSTPSYFQQGQTVGLDWQVAGIAKFQSGWFHHHRGIVWRNVNSGQVSIWFMQHGQMVGEMTPGTRGLDWTLLALDDFNGDGTSDLVWRNTTGAVSIWLLDVEGRVTRDVSPGIATSDWRLAGTGDFDRDGEADLLWTNLKSRSSSLWMIDGGITRSKHSMPAQLPEWSIRGVGDFDNDGKADIVWRNSSLGTVTFWFMNGPTVLRAETAGVASTEWTLVDTAYFN